VLNFRKGNKRQNHILQLIGLQFNYTSLANGSHIVLKIGKMRDVFHFDKKSFHFDKKPN